MGRRFSACLSLLWKSKQLPIFLSLILCAAAPVFGQGPPRHKATLKLAFYNVENLFDTIDDPATDDHDFTPGGANRWNGEKYRAKISNLARVIDDLEADILGLAEVESEAALRDLIRELHTDYNYIFRPTRDSRGISQALLYRGSVFFTDTVYQVAGAGLFRSALVITGEASGSPVTFMVCHQPSNLSSAKSRSNAAQSLRKYVERITARNAALKIVVMGDFNATPFSHQAREIIKDGLLENPFYDLARKGYGTYVWRDRRQMYDYILLSGNMIGKNIGQESQEEQKGLIFNGECGIFIREYMFSQQKDKGYPARSFQRGEYTGGFSDHLPVYLILENR